MSQEAPPVRENVRREHHKGKRYWFDVGKPEPNGKHEYRQVKETYFAACPGYHADAETS